MYDFNIDPNEVRRLVREAEQMRSQALADLLTTTCQRIAVAGSSAAKWIRALYQRRKFNLSVPAPHR